MYEKFFRMKQRPFAAMPVAAGYVATGSIEQARQQLARGIERAEGPGLVVGPAGIGKSLLLAVLAAQFADRFAVVQLASGRLRNVRALLQNILFELKLPYRDQTEGELRLALLDRLEPSDASQHGLLLLVDEAHVMPVRLLDELRMITNLVRGGEPRIRVVLAGDMRLEERFANPRLSSFQQRIAARCYLQPLTREETYELIRSQLTASGVAASELLNNDAMLAVHRASSGVPRLVNQLCDHTLILAAVASQRVVSAKLVEEAWADLQQLPLPTVEVESGNVEQGSIIEFGALDDAPAADTKFTRFDAPSARSQRDPFAQLDEIERQLAAANEDDFRPVSRFQPEIELSFAGPQQPFGGVFEEEEVVIDRYASLEAKTLRSRPHVTSREGREIAAMLGTTSTARQKLGVVSADPLDISALADAAGEAHEEPFDPASDPVMPDYYPHVSENTSTVRIVAEQPELIVIDTAPETPAAPLSPPTGRAQRQEYRQLFARLRRGG